MKPNQFLIFILMFAFSGLASFATHNIAAEIVYEHISGLTYQINVRTITRTSSPADRPELEISFGDGTKMMVQRSSEIILPDDRKQNSYTTTYTYAASGIYRISAEDPNRTGGIVNIPNSVNIPLYVESVMNTSLNNNSVDFFISPVTVAMLNDTFSINMTPYDKDTDYLSFELVNCKTTNGTDISGYWIPSGASINYTSGEFVWTNPNGIGEYNFSVKIGEWRNGVCIGTVLRDILVEVKNNNKNSPQFQLNASWNKDTTNAYTVYRNTSDSVLINVDLIQADSLQVFGEIFSGSDAAIVTQNLSGSTFKVSLKWNDVASRSRCAPYIVTFRAKVMDPPDVFHRDLTALIYVRDTALTCQGPSGPANLANVSFDNRKTNTIFVFPNPAKDSFKVNLKHRNAKGIFYLYNQVGEAVLEQPYDRENFMINSHRLSSGIYYYMVGTEGSGKIVIE